jgi:hypothetical protein
MDTENFKRQLPAPAEQSIEGVTETPLPASGGRPTKLTPKVIEDIVKWLKLGFYQEEAAIMAGISKTTFYDWMSKARDGDIRFSEFSDLLSPFVEMNYAFMQLIQAESTLFIQVGSEYSYFSDTVSSYFM